MVAAHRYLEPMVQVCIAMVVVMVCLMAAGPIRGFAEALAPVLAEDSVEVEAQVGVAAEADLVTGSRFDRRKDGYYAKRRWNRSCWYGTNDRKGCWFLCRLSGSWFYESGWWTRL